MADHRKNALAYIIGLFRHSRLVQRWAPVFIWMVSIFYFSSRPNPLSFLPSSGRGIAIDPLAHIGEYAGLTALLHRALREQESPSARLRTGRGVIKQGSGGEEGDFSSAPSYLGSSTLIAFAYALFDELHQELTPGRGFELADIGYDLAGIIATIGLIWLRKRGKASGGEGEHRIGTLRSCSRG